MSGDSYADRCRLLLRAYPPAYRQYRGEEILGTMLDAARPGQRWPGARDIAACATEGLRARLGTASVTSGRQAWLGGLRIAVPFLLTWAFAGSVWRVVGSPPPGPRAGAVVLMVALLTFLAMVRGWPVVAGALTLTWLVVGARSAPPSAYLVVSAACLAGMAILDRTILDRARRTHLSRAWAVAVPLVAAVAVGPQVLAHRPLLPEPLMLAVAVVGILGAFVDARAPMAAACLLVAQLLDQAVTLYLPWSGDATHVFVGWTPSWWTAAFGACLVALIFLSGRAVARALP